MMEKRCHQVHLLLIMCTNFPVIFSSLPCVLSTLSTTIRRATMRGCARLALFAQPPFEPQPDSNGMPSLVISPPISLTLYLVIAYHSMFRSWGCLQRVPVSSPPWNSFAMQEGAFPNSRNFVALCPNPKHPVIGWKRVFLIFRVENSRLIRKQSPRGRKTQMVESLEATLCQSMRERIKSGKVQQRAPVINFNRSRGFAGM